MSAPVHFQRPVRWQNLRADEAEKVVKERAQKTENIFISEHAYERVEGRTIIQADVYRILQKGTVRGQPEYNRETREWKIIMTRRMAGTRDAGVVALFLKDDDTLFVKTVMWMD